MIACDQPGCTRRAELACVVGEIRKVLCIEHQARYRQAMSCGGRTITIHHGVDLEDWSRPTIRRAAPVEDTPNLGLPHSEPEIVPLYSLATVLAVPTPPPAPPVPPPTLKVIMNKPRPLCLWLECERPNQQGPCCMMHNDRLRKLYGSAARLTEEQINAAPAAWDKRMEERAEASRTQLAQASKAKAASVVKARPVAPVPLMSEVPTVKAVASLPPVTDAPNVALALVLLDAASDLILDRKLRALLDAARAVLT
jgi:hypothetical protein